MEDCISSKLEAFKESINSFNTLITEWHETEKDKISPKQNENDLLEENLFLPYVGNGYVGVSLTSKEGIFAFNQKSASFPLHYNPIANIYSDTMSKKGKQIHR